MQKQKVFFAQSVLNRIPEVKRIIPIQNARVPIVKFIHTSTGLSCDLSFKNMMSTLNTEFIGRSISIDIRFRHLIMTVRYFLKTYDLSGGGLSGKVSNYALTMIVLFFLQRMQLFPPVRMCQNLAEQKIFIGGWQCGFCRNPNLIFQEFKPDDQKMKNASTFELLKEFFRFFVDFDFDQFVISPFLGSSVKKVDFLLKEKMNEIMEEYVDNLKGKPAIKLKTPVCVQDPFELNRCVTMNLTDNFVHQFKHYCKEALKVITDESVGNFNLLSIFALPPYKHSTVPKENNVTKVRENVSLSALHPVRRDKFKDGQAFLEAVTKIVEQLLQEALFVEMKKEGEMSDNQLSNNEKLMKGIGVDFNVKRSLSSETENETKRLKTVTNEEISNSKNSSEIEVSSTANVTTDEVNADKSISNASNNDLKDLTCKEEVDNADSQCLSKIYYIVCRLPTSSFRKALWTKLSKSVPLWHKMSTLDKEKRIGKSIVDQLPNLSNDKPEATFRLKVKLADSDKVEFEFEKESSNKNLYENWMMFLKSYLPKTCVQILNEAK